MSYKLVKFSSNYGDEFDVDGFSILTEDEYNSFFTGIDNATKFCNPGFGTNEDVDVIYKMDDIKTQRLCIKDCYDFTNITEEEYHMLHRLFGISYGIYFDPNQFIKTR